MTPHSRTRSISTVLIVAALALGLGLGGGGVATAAALAKNSVGSAQVKNGAIKAADIKSGALTGAQLKDGSVTGADVDESTLDLPPAPAAPFVVEGPYTYNATLTSSWTEYARVTFTAPTAGFVRLEAEATVVYNSSGTPGSYVDTLFYLGAGDAAHADDVGAYAMWPAPQPTGPIVTHPTTNDVMAVAAGEHTVVLHMRQPMAGGHFAGLQNVQVDAMFFPEGSALPHP